MNRLFTKLNFKKTIIAAAFGFASLGSLSAQENAMWTRYSAISPDGSTIVFSYKGDIYSVPSAGGTATPLTISESYEYSPVWSHDGKSIAFASDRYGNFDVFVIPATGGEAKRLTFNSTKEFPISFSADDKSVYFSATRQDLASNAQFPSGLLSELYSVPVAGGRVSMVLPVPALHASVNASGDKIIYEDVKGYENEWRKHHVSAVTRDVWEYDFNAKKYKKLTAFAGEDRSPVFGANNDDYYYLSEQGGSFNVYKSSLSQPDKNSAVTKFTKNPVRFLSRANNNTLCFSFDGEIYTMKEGEEPKKVSIRVMEDGRSNLEKFVPISGDFSDATLSPNGKEFAYVYRGEIFVSSVDGGVTKRITNTPYQERSMNFSPDGRSLVYAAECDNNWNLYTVSIAREDEPYFYASTVLKTDTILATPAEEYQPMYSPNGKEVAYLENRQTLKVLNLASKETRLVLSADNNYSYADGDQYYQWSPDGKWFAVQFGDTQRMFSPEVGIISADGKGELHNISMSGYDDMSPKWSKDGSMLIWGTDRYGLYSASGSGSSLDVVGVFLNKAAYDKYNLSKEDYTLYKEKEDKKNKDKDKAKTEESKSSKKKKNESADAAKDSTQKDIVIDFEGINDRKERLTTHDSPANDWVLSKDHEKLFYITRFEKDAELWVTELRTKETKSIANLGARYAGMEISDDGKFLFVVAGGRAMKIDAESGKTEPLKTSGEMIVRNDQERQYIFEHSWRQLKEKFYVADLQGVDWDYYHNTYKKFLPYISNNYDFSEMLSEMLGEMNASHTGCSYHGMKPNTDQTASLGVFYDYDYKTNGLKVAEVITGGPLDKADSKVKSGTIIEKIDGETIPNNIDFYSLLNRKNNKYTLLSLFDPATNERWDETVKPFSTWEESELLYHRWVENRRKEVDSLSGGKLGYVHVRGMDDESMRVVVEEALGRNIKKEALIVDTRFNGGGNIHERLSDFLSGKKYMDIVPHGQYIGSEPLDKWVKPSIVLISEGCYSDAHLFPVAYKLKNIGKTLGMPIAGTGTFVWWETQIDPSLVFGIPMGGWKTPDGKFCENNQMEPDIKVPLDPSLLTAGRDEQIEAAVKELMKK